MKKKRPRILIVDDDLDLIHTMCFLYSNALNAEVKGVSESKYALDRVRHFEPHLITTGIGMSHVTGYDFIRKVRSAGYSHLPIFVISARCFPENIERAYQMGANEYMIKPVDSAVLINKVEIALAEHYPELFVLPEKQSLKNAPLDLFQSIRNVFDEKKEMSLKQMIYIEANALERVQLSASAQIEGYKVTSAIDFLSGLSAIDSVKQCDVAVMNCRLPLRDCPEHIREKTHEGELGGWILAQRIKQRFPACKIFITLEGETCIPKLDSDLTQDVQLLVKPLPIHELVELL